MTLRKILCPIDFSAGSDHALRLATRIARSSGAELVIAHAWHIPELAYAAEAWTVSADLMSVMIKEAESGLAAASAQAIQLGAPRVSTTLQQGRPGDRIVQTLSDDPAFDLVVVGTHGRTGLKRVLLGSVAEYVVRHSPCSVIAARERLEDLPFRNVLCAVDFSDSSRLAAELAAELAGPDAKLTLFHAIELPSAYASAPELAEQLERGATKLLERWSTELHERTGVKAAALTTFGVPGGEVLGAIDGAVYDLVALGSHGRTGIRRALTGSVAEKVVRHAWSPVLVARARKP